MDAVQLKRRYRNDWIEANAREYVVLAWLNKSLLHAFDKHTAYARLTGLGAGYEGHVGRSYSGLSEAFDITVFIDGRPCCYVEVTGVESWGDLVGFDGDKARVPLCVGGWKLRKAERHGVLDRVWFAFVVLETSTIKVLWARHLAEMVSAEAPWLREMVLSRGEGPSYCVPAARWKPRSVLVKWIKERGLVYAGVG